MEPRVSMITLPVEDPSVSCRFYCEGLGWKPSFATDEIIMFRIGDEILLSFWQHHAFRAEIGAEMPRPVPPVTLAHNVESREQVDALLAVVEQVAGARVEAAENRRWGGYSGYFSDPDGYRWEVSWNPGRIGQLVLPSVRPLNAPPRPAPWPMHIGSTELREPRDEDIEQLLSMRDANETVDNMLDARVSPEVFRRQWRNARVSHSSFSCVAWRGSDMVGMGHLNLTDGIGQPDMPRLTEASIGYVVHPDFWGKGVATDIGRGLLRAAFNSLEVRRVTAGTYTENVGSVKALERLGMRREHHGIEDSWHDKRGWLDSYRYAMLRSEWQERKTLEQT